MNSLQEDIRRAREADFSVSSMGRLQLASLDGVARLTVSGALDGDRAMVADSADTLEGLVPFIDAVLDAVVLIDGQSLLIVAANEAAARLLGSSRRGLTGRSALDLAATPEDACYWADPAERRDGELLSDSLVVRDDGDILPVTRRIARLELADQTLFMFSFRDRSQQPARRVRARDLRRRTGGDARLGRGRAPRHRPDGPHPRLQSPLRRPLVLARTADCAARRCSHRSLDGAEHEGSDGYRQRLLALRDETIARRPEALESITDVLRLATGESSSA